MLPETLRHLLTGKSDIDAKYTMNDLNTIFIAENGGFILECRKENLL